MIKTAQALFLTALLLCCLQQATLLNDFESTTEKNVDSSVSASGTKETSIENDTTEVLTANDTTDTASTANDTSESSEDMKTAAFRRYGGYGGYGRPYIGFGFGRPFFFPPPPPPRPWWYRRYY